MIRPRLRLYVCASAVAVTLGGAVLTQAAGPGEFISNLWNRKPAPKKEVVRHLNPFKWLNRGKSDSTVRRVKVSDGGQSVVSQRPELVSDPFLTERLPRASTSAATDRKKVIVRPQPRQRPATKQTVDLAPPATSRGVRDAADNVRRTRLANSVRPGGSSRAAAVAKKTLPEVRSAPQKPASNGKFVDGFDSEFQKLFKEVIEESRQSEAKTPTPRLPDQAVADFTPPGAASLPEVAATDEDDSREDFARFAQKRDRIQLEDLIRDSRKEMDSSALALRATTDRSSLPSTPGQSVSGRSVSEPTNNSQTGLSAVSHSDANNAAATPSSDSGSRFTPQRLPDQSRPQTVNQLVVPSSIVPDRQLFTTSDDWMNRDELQRQAAVENAPAPDLQPVVRVVPGHRGAGVVIESGQWSPLQPRVSSNVAPTRSVPDTSQFRRLSFEGANASTESGAVQAISDDSQGQAKLSTNSPHAGQSTMMIPASPGDVASSVPSSLTADSDSGEEMAMIIPDSRTGQSLDAAKLGAAFDAAPTPPRISDPVFEWPDETEVAADSANGGFSWGATMFFLTLIGGSIGLFFRRKAQGGAFGITGTGTKSEIS